MNTMHRIVVVGSSGSGKTTFARRLASYLDLPHLAMDAVFHRHGLAHIAHQDFLPVLDEFTDQDRWILDGNYTSHGTRDVVWPKADTIVWLDLPRRTALSRVVKRTLRRLLTREEMWPGVREPFSNLYRLDPRHNIIVWTWTRHGHVREKYEEAIVDGSLAHADVRRLRTEAETDAFLDSVRSPQH
jgi:adenylate kinase family enzyme